MTPGQVVIRLPTGEGGATAGRQSRRVRGTTIVRAVLLSLIFVVTARSQDPPAGILNEIGIDQKLNEQVPLDLTFHDEMGRPVLLRDYFGKKPVILVFVYYECPMLCTLTLNGLVRSLRAIPFDVGKEFNVVTVSFDPQETAILAARKKLVYIDEYRRAGAEAGWHFLTGDQAAIEALTNAAGFRYQYDPQSQQWAHATAIMVLTPEGRLSRYFYGVEYSARDLRLSLVEAAENRIGTPVDRVLLYCYHYDPIKGRYGLVIMNLLRIGGTATVLALAAFIMVMIRRDRIAGTRLPVTHP
jgi:protein SCO1/2